MFRSFILSADGSRLEYVDSSGARFNAPKRGDQVAYSRPRISPDGRYLGWLALHPNCCTSYPVPLALVVMDAGRRLREFQGDQATFGWCFQSRSGLIAYRRALLHGPTPETFELRRIRDGKLLKSFQLRADDPGGMDPAARLPSWAGCAAD